MQQLLWDAQWYVACTIGVCLVFVHRVEKGLLTSQAEHTFIMSFRQLLVSTALCILIAAILASSTQSIAPLRPYTLLALPSSSIRIHIPSTHAHHPITSHAHAAIVHGMARMMSELAGGCTASPAYGYWIDRKGRMVEEVTRMRMCLCMSCDGMACGDMI